MAAMVLHWSDMSESVSIKLEGPRLTPDKFVNAVQKFFSIVLGVTKNVVGVARPEDWSVEVDHGSAIVRIKPENPAIKASRSIDLMSRGIKSLASGVRSAPPGFGNDEVKAAKELASLIDADGKFIKAIYIVNGEAPMGLTEEVGRSADAILSSEKHIAFGSIEGRVETLSDKEGQSGFQCTIKDPIYQRQVIIHFTKKELEDRAYEAFRKRVLVSGLIRYSKEGNPTSVDADYLKVFPEESELPTVQDVQAIYK